MAFCRLLQAARPEGVHFWFDLGLRFPLPIFNLLPHGLTSSATKLGIGSVPTTTTSRNQRSLVSYNVLLTDSAVKDLEELDEFILSNDSVDSADYILGKHDDVIGTLEEYPERGDYPPELAAIGIQDYREIFFKPYRVIYRVIENKVYIYLVVDGRRDMQTLLQRRLFSV